MERLTGYLKDILFLHDCIILPGIGGFVCRTQSAVIDDDKKIISAPQKIISFNSSLSENDGVLADFIARRERIPYTDALRRLNVLAGNLKRKLETERKVTLEGIGTLYCDRLSNIIFKQGKCNFYIKNCNSLPFPAEIRQIQVPHYHISKHLEIKKAFTRGVAAALIAGGIFGLYRHSPELFEFKGNDLHNNASFEMTFPFLPNSPQKKSCEYTISPECDYLDFIAGI